MSDDAGRGGPRETDRDAWAAACEEDLAAEKERRRAEYGPPPVSAAEELRRLADAVADRVGELGRPFGGSAAASAVQGMAQQLFSQARQSVQPVVERNPEVFDHLASAGNELLAAYRSAVQEAERRWTEQAAADSGGRKHEREADEGESGDARERPRAERIELDGLEGIDDRRAPGEPAGPSSGAAATGPAAASDATSGPSDATSGSADASDGGAAPGRRQAGDGFAEGEPRSDRPSSE